MQIHTEGPDYDHQAFKPWRIPALAFKAIRRLYPDYPLWRDFAYEYEQGKLAIDVINGGPLLRDWVDDALATPGDSREPGRRKKYDPTADREHSLATLYPSKSSLIVNPTARQQTPATLKSP